MQITISDSFCQVREFVNARNSSKWIERNMVNYFKACDCMRLHAITIITCNLIVGTKCDWMRLNSCPSNNIQSHTIAPNRIKRAIAQIDFPDFWHYCTIISQNYTIMSKIWEIEAKIQNPKRKFCLPSKFSTSMPKR